MNKYVYIITDTNNNLLKVFTERHLAEEYVYHKGLIDAQIDYIEIADSNRKEDIFFEDYDISLEELIEIAESELNMDTIFVLHDLEGNILDASYSKVFASLNKVLFSMSNNMQFNEDDYDEDDQLLDIIEVSAASPKIQILDKIYTMDYIRDTFLSNREFCMNEDRTYIVKVNIETSEIVEAKLEKDVDEYFMVDEDLDMEYTFIRIDFDDLDKRGVESIDICGFERDIEELEHCVKMVV